jgi:hypothetical protein
LSALPLKPFLPSGILMSASSSLSPRVIVSRVAASLLGGYVFVWGFVTLGICLLLLAGMPYDDAQTLAYLLAFLVFLWAFCWAFCAARLVRIWAVLLGGGAMMSIAAWLIARSLL